jgi:asparagine synthase (glutamine-hydrolysing)
MCGICGEVSVYPSNLQEAGSNVRWMMERIRHRGPDDSGIWNDQNVVLGHRRLSIIDLSPTGRQPMVSGDGKKVIVFNGEIYNYRSLREQFRNEIQFRYSNDTEVILQLYEKFGPDCLQYLRGMFAFVIWDSSLLQLFFARDRLGKKPFFYALKDQRFRFASELHALVGQNAGELEINEEALSHYLTLQYVPSPHTIYRGVSKLPPGHYGIFKNGNLKIHQYWEVNHSARSWNEPDALERFTEIFSESVQYRMISDVPVGAFLSGGIDSSAVVGMMREVASGPLRTFTVRFAEKQYDESPFARIVAERFQTEHHDLTVTPDLVEILPELVRHYSEPYGDSSAIPFYYLSKTTREHVKVALSGDGGDELFGGYSRYMFPQPHFLLPGSLRNAVRLLPVNLRYIWRIRKFLEERSFDLTSIYLQKVGVFNEQEKQHLLTPDFTRNGRYASTLTWFENVFERFGHVGFPEKMMAVDLVTYLPDDLLVKADIAAMACSLEVRSPFLDHELVEFASTLPGYLKIRNGSGKYLLKQHLRPKLPAAIVEREKAGFVLPMREWFRGKLKPYIEDVLLSRSALSEKYFRKGAIEKLIRDHQSGWYDNTFKIYALLALELWHSEFRN